MICSLRELGKVEELQSGTKVSETLESGRKEHLPHLGYPFTADEGPASPSPGVCVAAALLAPLETGECPFAPLLAPVRNAEPALGDAARERVVLYEDGVVDIFVPFPRMSMQ